MAAKTHRVLPGFGLALGYTLVYLSLLILLPLIATRELSKKLGPGVLRKLLLEVRQ